MGSGIAESVAVACCRLSSGTSTTGRWVPPANGSRKSLARAVKRGKVSDAGEVLERIELTTHLGAMRDRA
jgi:3-hydroxyacyl-CoA dehydrogenase